MKKAHLIGWVLSALPLLAFSASTPYEQALQQWSSPADVSLWLKDNFKFDHRRNDLVNSRLKQMGADGLMTQAAANTFAKRSGVCQDAAKFMVDAINVVDPQAQAATIFIKNKFGIPNHWVAGYKKDGQLYVVDYGAGPKWEAMKGVLGPFENLDAYRSFLESLRVPGFGVELVRWRELPGGFD